MPWESQAEQGEDREAGMHVPSLRRRNILSDEVEGCAWQRAGKST